MAEDLTKTFTRREPAGTSLSDRIRAAVQTTQTSQTGSAGSGMTGPEHALLLDVSGSMESWISPNVRAIDELAKVAREFQGVRKFEFASSTREMKPTDNPGDGDTVGTGTNVALALLTAKSKGVLHAIVITDGQPDDADAALRAAKGIRVDVFYIGPDPAPQFCRDLANQTGGQYGRASLKAAKALTASVRALLPAPKATIQL